MLSGAAAGGRGPTASGRSPRSLPLRMPGQGHPSFPAAILCLLALMAGPLMALPFAISALLVRIHPLLAVCPVLLWLWPSVLQEVTFHGLAAPWMWPLLLLATWPAFGRHPRTFS